MSQILDRSHIFVSSSYSRCSYRPGRHELHGAAPIHTPLPYYTLHDSLINSLRAHARQQCPCLSPIAPFRSFIPTSGRYERSERAFGDVLSSLNAHVTARMEESEYSFSLLELFRIKVVWLITSTLATKFWLAGTTDPGRLQGRGHSVVQMNLNAML